MKKTKNILVALALIIAAGLTSCIKEDYTASTDETATVNLVFDTRTSGQTESVGTVGAHEGIKTLRVIIVDRDKQQVDVNELRDFSNSPNPVVRKELTILGLPVGTKDFYVVANEACVGLGDRLAAYTGKFTEAQKKELLNMVTDASPACFPKTSDDIASLGLPISGRKEGVVISPKDNHTLEIGIDHAVAKFVLFVNNQTGVPQTVTGIKLLKVGATQTTLFAPGSPANKDYTPAYTGNVDVEVGDVTAESTDAVSKAGYFYESKAQTQNDYCLQATWNGETKTFLLANIDGLGLNGRIYRNQQVNITLTLKQDSWKLDYEVVDWTDNEVGIDFTNLLSYMSQGWTEDTYLEMREGNEVHMAPDKEAELKFVINSPSGATWHANLTEGDVNAFEFVGPASGSAYTPDGTPLEQTLKVRVTNPESDETFRATLKVFAEIGGHTYEMDLTNPGQEVEPGEGEAVNHFTLLQSR